MAPSWIVGLLYDLFILFIFFFEEHLDTTKKLVKP